MVKEKGIYIAIDALKESLNNLGKTLPFLNNEIIREITRMNKSGEKDFGNFIWMLFILQKTIESGNE